MSFSFAQSDQLHCTSHTGHLSFPPLLFVIDDEADEIVAFGVKRQVAANTILAYMLDRYGVDRDQFFCDRRKADLSRIRHETWWLVRQLTPMTKVR